MTSTVPAVTAPVTAPPTALGTARTRVEGREKITGAARYTGDIPLTSLAHGSLVLSTIARGRIRAVDDAAVRAMPGVVAVLHHLNAPRVRGDYPSIMGMAPDPTVRAFQDDRVPHWGWPVALVVAETPEQARAGADALVVAYEAEPHDTDFSGERTDAFALDGVVPATLAKGDEEAELAASAVVVDASYTTPEEHHNPMEPHAATAYWQDGRLEVLDSNQGASWTAEDLAKAFELEPGTVRVRSEHVGGGFGSKSVRVHQIAAVMAATELQRPVRVAMTRRQMFSLAGYRSPTDQRVRLGADPDGRLRVLSHGSVSQTSSVYAFVEPAAAAGRVLYDAAAHRTSAQVVSLDVPTPTSMRAPGMAPGSFALESALDELAERCGLDPIELRLRNEPSAGPLSGLPFAGRNLRACFEEGARRFGWADRDPRPRVRRDGRWLLGTGTAAATFHAFAVPSTAAVTAWADGTFTVRIAAADIGTGARTALQIVAADALRVAPERVQVRIGDSEFGPAWLAGGSAGTSSWAWAITPAAGELRERLALGVDIPADGLTVRSDSTTALAGQEPAERHSYGAQFAEVAVDPGTGEVRVRRMLGMFAAGRIVNPLTARNQLVGGMVWGISMALHEEAVRDVRSGSLVGADLAGYHVASHADVAHIEADWVDDPMPGDPIGIKGVGEIGVVGAAAAIANAVRHATGVRHRRLPIRPDRVLCGESVDGGPAGESLERGLPGESPDA
ncbi:xanthine dehydrogenase family protein molybdopterin-binding subunit [Streptomyces sp. YC504]|uniref:Xanthine dehydrogenase family protein molybdopterin-binding subunit n=1 Tax=Streptomyces mesophilus TaxID=1775132 RepID=A0A6G4XQX5_9ACTN|nr:xanthine dehydrogenase family protein molybdopterin-binding subunit [Streptomyces mesophilus]NGO79613.1 xanthine dehydrogenase family protein molybdopterin-binding subunit [Streptomyces mesophilus]